MRPNCVAAVVSALALVAPAAAQAETCDAPGQVPPFRQCSTDPPSADFEIGSSNPRPEPGTTIVFHSKASANKDRKLVREEWDFDGDGTYDATGHDVEHGYAAAGDYEIKLHVVDDHGAESRIAHGLRIYRPLLQGIELGAESVDLLWPNMTKLHGRVVPAEVGIKQVMIRGLPLQGAEDVGATLFYVPVAADGTFSFARRFAGNTRFTAEPADSDYNGPAAVSAPLDVFVDWRAQWGWSRIHGNLVAAGFVVRPIDVTPVLSGKLFYLYWHRPGGKWMRRVAQGRVRISRTSHAFGYRRFNIRHPGARDRVFFCIRGAGSDGWGRPSSGYDLGCGLRKLRW